MVEEEGQDMGREENTREREWEREGRIFRDPRKVKENTTLDIQKQQQHMDPPKCTRYLSLLESSG